jgi:hypothetical protein
MARQAKSGKVAPKVGKEASEAVRRLNTWLAARVEDLTPSDYIESKRFLNRLKAAVGSVDPAKLGRELKLARQATAKGKTLPELVEFMSAKKLKFAPSLKGEDARYQELHRLMSEAVAAGKKGR